MKEILDSYIDNAFGSREQATFKFFQFELNYKKYFPENKESYLLDIGIGRGEMLSCFKKWGYKNGFGIDISKSCIDFCKSLGLNCELVDSVEDYLIKNPERFDLITILDVLEHISREKVINFLKSVKIALKKEGILIIQVPNMQAPDSNLHMYNDITHFVGYTEHSLAQLLVSVGFSKFEFSGFEEFYKNDLKTKIKKVLRYFYWKYVRILRAINGNLNPKILHPVFYAVVYNE